MTLEDLPPEPPVISLADNLLTVESRNATLHEILLGVQRATGAELESLPAMAERVAVHLSGSPSDVISALLNGSRYGYVLICAPDNPLQVQRVILSEAPAVEAQPRAATGVLQSASAANQARAGLPGQNAANMAAEPPADAVEAFTDGDDGPDPDQQLKDKQMQALQDLYRRAQTKQQNPQ